MNNNFYDNLNSLFVAKSSKLQIVDDEVYHGIILDGDNRIHTFPIVDHEERFLSAGSSESYTYISICSYGKPSEIVRLKSCSIFSSKTYRTCFGNQPFAAFDTYSWEIFFEALNTMLSEVEQKEIYMYTGWSQNLDECILGSIKVDMNNMLNISSGLVKKDVVLLNSSPQEICAVINDIMEHISTNFFVGYLMLDYYMLSFVKQRTILSTNVCPQFDVNLGGITGKYKTSTALAVFNPMGIPICSFEDTLASIRRTFQSNKSGITIIDDYKCQTKSNDAKYELITRISGDIGTVGKRVSGDKVNDDPVTGMGVITGEVRPKLQQSSYARILFVDLNENPIDKEVLTQLQNKQSEYNTFIAYFIQYIMSQPDFDKKFVVQVHRYRDELQKDVAYNGMHGRYYDMYGWLAAMWDFYTAFLQEFSIALDSDFKNTLKRYIYKQHCRYDNNPVKLFKTGYLELLDANELTIIDSKCIEGLGFDIIDYGDRLFVKSNSAYKKICKYWEDNGMVFPCSERALRNKMSEVGILQAVNGKTTTEKKTRDNKSYSGYYLLKNYFLNYGGTENE